MLKSKNLTKLILILLICSPLVGCKIMAKDRLIRLNDTRYALLYKSDSEKARKHLAKKYKLPALNTAQAVKTNEEFYIYKPENQIIPNEIKTPSFWRYNGYTLPYNLVNSYQKRLVCGEDIKFLDKKLDYDFLERHNIVNLDHSKENYTLIYSSTKEDNFPLKKFFIDDQTKKLSREVVTFQLSKQNVETLNNYAIDLYQTVSKACKDLPTNFVDYFTNPDKSLFKNYGISIEALYKHNITEDEYVYLVDSNKLESDKLEIFNYYEAPSSFYNDTEREIFYRDKITQYFFDESYLSLTKIITKDIHSKPMRFSGLKITRKSKEKYIQDYFQGIDLQGLNFITDLEIPSSIIDSDTEDFFFIHKDSETFIVKNISGSKLILHGNSDNYYDTHDTYRITISPKQKFYHINAIDKNNTVFDKSFIKKAELDLFLNTYDFSSKVSIKKTYDSKCRVNSYVSRSLINKAVTVKNKKIQDNLRKYLYDKKDSYYPRKLKLSCNVSSAEHYPLNFTIDYHLRQGRKTISVKAYLPSVFLPNKKEPTYEIYSY